MKCSWMRLCLPMADTLRAPELAYHIAVLSFLPQMLLYLLPPFIPLSSSSSASFLFLFPSASHFTFLLCRELCVVSYLPPVAFKVFLSAKHPIHCHRNRKLSVEEKKKKKSGSLKLCNSVILPKSINGNMLGDMQKPAAWGNKRRKGHPFLGNFHRFETPVESRTEQACAERISALPLHGRELPVESGKLDKSAFYYLFCL